MSTINLTDSYAVRDNISIEAYEHIQQLYRDAAAQIQAEINKLSSLPNKSISGQMRESYLRELQGQINDALADITQKIEADVNNYGLEVAGAVISDNFAWLNNVGIDLNGAFSHVPKEAVEAVASGQLYGLNGMGVQWNLSESIWGNNEKTLQAINDIIANGLSQNMSALEIAKELELFVNPDKTLPWDWNIRYPGSGAVIDYNAQRLVRTMLNHVYQYALVAITENNPFVSGYIWHSVHDPNTCEICADLDGQFFAKGALPLDHPNGLCYWTVDIPMSLDEVAEKLAAWVHGESDADIDRYMADIAGRLPKLTAAALQRAGSVLNRNKK